MPYLTYAPGWTLAPGRELTLMGLRVAITKMLARTERLLPAGEAPVRERPPARLGASSGGLTALPWPQCRPGADAATRVA